MTDGERAAAWRRDGYLMVRDAIAPEYLEPIRAFIGERVDAFARQRHAAGDIATLHEREPFGRRYAAIHEELSGRNSRSLRGNRRSPPPTCVPGRCTTSTPTRPSPRRCG